MRTPNRTPNTSGRRAASTLAGLAGLALLANCGAALGQAGSKDSQKFIGYSEESRETIADARGQLEKSLEYYNALVTGEAKNPKSDYKGFSKALERTEKLADKTRKLVDKMQSQAKRVFKRWQKEIDEYQNETLRELGAKRLEVTKQRYEQMIERMRAAGEAYDPLITSLRDQDLFMGRDLSTDALANLAPMADEVNRMAGVLYVRIAEVLEEQVNDEALAAEEDVAPTEDQGQ